MRGNSDDEADEGDGDPANDVEASFFTNRQNLASNHKLCRYELTDDLN
jgi:hypothetical protein